MFVKHKIQTQIKKNIIYVWFGQINNIFFIVKSLKIKSKGIKYHNDNIDFWLDSIVLNVWF